MTVSPLLLDVVTDDALTLRVQVHGAAGTDVPVVLVHGYTGGSVDWDPLLPGLAAERPVVVYDQRGHGLSDRGAPERYTVAQLVADLGRVVNRVRTEFSADGVALVGHSLGGVVAMEYAVAHPDVLTSLVLMDTSGAPDFQVPEQVAEIAAVGREAGMAVVAQLVVDFLRTQTDGAAMSDEVVDTMVAKLAATDVEAFDALARELNSFEPVRGLDVLAVPTTVVVGELDAGLRDAAERLAATVPGADLVVIPAAGHSPQDDAPALVLDVFRRHLARART